MIGKLYSSPIIYTYLYTFRLVDALFTVFIHTHRRERERGENDYHTMSEGVETGDDSFPLPTLATGAIRSMPRTAAA